MHTNRDNLTPHQSLRRLAKDFALQEIDDFVKRTFSTEELPVAQFKGVKLLGVTICSVLLLILFCILTQVLLQRKRLCHSSGEELSVNLVAFSLLGVNLFLSSSLSYFSLHPKSAVLLRVSSTSRFLQKSFKSMLLDAKEFAGTGTDLV